MLRLNPNKQHVNKIINSIIEKDGYCCCQILKNDDAICPLLKYSELPEQIEPTNLCGTGIEIGRCVCNVYVESEV